MPDDFPILPFVPESPLVRAEGDLAEIWRNIFPWADLRAQGPPEHWLTLGREVLPTLAVLAASGQQTEPKLLHSDVDGRLETATALNPNDKLPQPLLGATAVVMVGDVTLFPIGSMVAVQTVSNEFRWYRVIGHTSAGQIVLDQLVVDNYAAGTVLTSVPLVSTVKARGHDDGIQLVNGPFVANTWTDVSAGGLVTADRWLRGIQIGWGIAGGGSLQVRLKGVTSGVTMYVGAVIAETGYSPYPHWKYGDGIDLHQKWPTDALVKVEVNSANAGGLVVGVAEVGS